MAQEQIDIRKMNEELNILKRQVAELTENIREDLEFAIRTELAYQRHESGEFIEMDSEEFLKEIKKW